MSKQERVNLSDRSIYIGTGKGRYEKGIEYAIGSYLGDSFVLKGLVTKKELDSKTKKEDK